MAIRINEINWIVLYVAVQIFPSLKPEGVFGGPSASFGIIIPRAVADEARIPIIEAAGEAKRLEARIRIQDHIAELIVVHPLHDSTTGNIHDEPWTAEMIADDPIRDSALEHVLWDIPGPTATVDKAADESAATIELGDGLELILVQKALHERAVDGLTRP